ncbi:transmembrane protein, putative (macronuclear) [Tetrahymena thermophila SB210]|uniref:Transmembrane protein, putative n=1 Tax=Tetrahymena thermophila (strain SB210) TaxID=312017 RepID=I7M6T7_TETTS|nr:transmembrane protein, putative [Tetrahymena thermophila SB210]EAR86101.2 transmembrane protein, putative [Tetrahymena thermophila SB210]|eukprot:XP_976696.2 transmembrane protein, putative [Tetrahymena thermophila SB210]
MSSEATQQYKKADTKMQINPERELSPVIFLAQASGWESPVSLRNEKSPTPTNNLESHQYFSEKSKSVTPFSPQIKGVLKNKQDTPLNSASTASQSLKISESSSPQNVNKLLNNFLSTRNSSNQDKKIDFSSFSNYQQPDDMKEQISSKIQHRKLPSDISYTQSNKPSNKYSDYEYKKQIVNSLCNKIQEQSKKIEYQESQMQNQKKLDKERQQEVKDLQNLYQKQKIIIEQQLELENTYKRKIDDLQNELSSKKNTIECLKIDHLQELQSIYEKNQQEVASLRQSMVANNPSNYESVGKSSQSGQTAQQQLQNFNSTITVKSQIMEDSINLIKNKKNLEVQELLQKLQKIDQNTANLMSYEREEKAYLHQRVKELNLKIIELEQQALKKEEWCQIQINQESDKIYKFFEKESSKQDQILNEQKETLKITYEEQIKQIQEMLKKQKNRNKDMASELKQQIQENDKLIEKQKEIEQQNQHLTQVNLVLKNQNIEFSTIIANQKQKINSNSEEIGLLNNQISNNQNEIKLLQLKNASLDGQLKEIGSQRIEHLEIRQKYANLLKEYESINSKFQEQNKIFLELQADNQILQDQLNHFRSNKLGDQIEQFKRGCTEDELKFKIQHLEKVLEEKEIYIRELIEIQNLSTENINKKSADYLAQQKELVEQQEQLKQQNYQLQIELEKLKTQYKQLENQHLETLTTQREEINNLYIQLQVILFNLNIKNLFSFEKRNNRLSQKERILSLELHKIKFQSKKVSFLSQKLILICFKQKKKDLNSKLKNSNQIIKELIFYKNKTIIINSNLKNSQIKLRFNPNKLCNNNKLLCHQKKLSPKCTSYDFIDCFSIQSQFIPIIHQIFKLFYYKKKCNQFQTSFLYVVVFIFFKLNQNIFKKSILFQKFNQIFLIFHQNLLIIYVIYLQFYFQKFKQQFKFNGIGNDLFYLIKLQKLNQKYNQNLITNYVVDIQFIKIIRFKTLFY